MDHDVVLTWNWTNWITVVLMVALGFAVVRVAITLFNRGRQNAQMAA